MFVKKETCCVIGKQTMLTVRDYPRKQKRSVTKPTEEVWQILQEAGFFIKLHKLYLGILMCF